VPPDAVTVNPYMGEDSVRPFISRPQNAAVLLCRTSNPGAKDFQDLLCDGLQGISRLDAPEQHAWSGWPGARLSPKNVLGEGLTAAAAWHTLGIASPWWSGLPRCRVFRNGSIWRVRLGCSM
jgi:hypothetical protein